jgi:hypothetical protein
MFVNKLTAKRKPARPTMSGEERGMLFGKIV